MKTYHYILIVLAIAIVAYIIYRKNNKNQDGKLFKNFSIRTAPLEKQEMVDIDEKKNIITTTGKVINLKNA